MLGLAPLMQAEAVTEPFCNDGDGIGCDFAWIRALERQADGADLATLQDLAAISMGTGTALSTAASARMVARAMDRAGYRDAAWELLRDAKSAVAGSGWIESAHAMVAVAKQRHLLGDPNAALGMTMGTVHWPDRLSAWERMSVFSALAVGLDDIGDRVKSREMFSRALAEARRAPVHLPHEYGNRIDVLSALWYSVDERGYAELAAEIESEVVGLFEQEGPERLLRRSWPLTVEDFRRGPPKVSRVPQ